MAKRRRSIAARKRIRKSHPAETHLGKISLSKCWIEVVKIKVMVVKINVMVVKINVMVVKIRGHVYAHRLIVVFTRCELGRMLVDHIVQSHRLQACVLPPYHPHDCL